MKHWLQKLIVVSMIGAACAQVEVARAQYSLSHRKEPYKPLNNAMNIPMRWADTVNPYTYVDLYGLSFRIFGEEFKLDNFYPIGISKWGNVEIRNERNAVIIDPFHTSVLDSLRPTAQVSLDVSGTVGDRILKIQWRDIGFEQASPELFANFQLWMYERTSNVEFYYGDHTIGCDKTDPSLQGAYVGMFIAPADFSKLNKIFWIYGDPENPKVSKMNIRAMDCVFAPNTAVTLATPSASVADDLNIEAEAGRIVSRSGKIQLEGARSIKLYSIMGQLVRSTDNGENALQLEGLSAGRYFLEYEKEGEAIRRAVAIE